MRRKDREVTDFGEILRIIDGCANIRLGLADGDFPYIVPVNFAYTAEGGCVRFYIHGAMAGRKYEMLKAHPLCSFEMDIPLGLDCMAEKKSVTMRYRSVMGKAEVRFLEGEEKRRAMDAIIMARYEKTRNFDYNTAALARTAVGELNVLELSAKENPPAARADGDEKQKETER